MSLEVQWWTMAAMLMSGIGMGVVFDGYRVVSDELRINRWWIPVFDLLYWIAATVVVFQILSASNEGEVRAYVFLGLLLGIGCYYWLLSKLVILFTHGLIRALRALFQYTVRAFIVLVVRPIGLLFRLGKMIFGLVLALALFLFKVVIQLIRPLWLLVRWMIGPLVRPLLRRVKPLLDKWRVRERTVAFGSMAASWWRRIWKRRGKDDGGDGGTTGT